MNNAVSGSILETDYHTIPLRVKSLNLVTSTAGPTITMEYDCPYSILELTTNAADIINTWWNTCGQTYNVALGQGRYETLTTARKVLSLRTAHQFYRSNNLVVQAYPLRGMIVDNNTRTTYTFLSSNFANATPTDRKKTHVHSESLIV
jgi:predicted amino acid dehydrogenase